MLKNGNKNFPYLPVTGTLPPIAARLFYPAFGLVLRLEIAAISMSGSSLLVAINALMLKNTNLEGISAKP